MAAFIARNSLRAFAPVATASAIAWNSIEETATSCDAPTQTTAPVVQKLPKHEVDGTKSLTKAGMHGEGDEHSLFHNLFPKRQLWKPSLEYPMWDENWDERALEHEGSNDDARKLEQKIRREGVTRHIILIRHGQYDETHKEDEKRLLTELGRKQADLTGRRLAEIVKGIDEKFGPCDVKTIRVSNMARAKETAEIIAKHLPDINQAPPDQLLNEGRPSHHIPCGTVRTSTIEAVDKNHPRIEEAFRKYFYRAPYKPDKDTTLPGSDNDDEKKSEHAKKPKHEFEIIVCHANVIRYFFCRALQLPPEAWLRLCTFNCSLTYLTIRPTGTVSCRMLGDIGHLGYDHSTFSMHHGFNW